MGEGLFHHIQQSLGIGSREERTERHQLPVEKLQKVMIEAGAIDVIIDTHEKRCIDVEFQTFEEGPEMKITHENEELSIVAVQEKENRWFNLNMQKAVLTMTVPAQVAKEWDIQATSRKVSIRDIQTSGLRAGVSSGSLICETIQAEQLMVKASSGRIDMKHIAAEQVESSITSGLMRFAQVHSKQLNVATTSGTIQLNDVVSKIFTGKCTSGKIDVNNVQLDHVTTTCSSGSLHLRDASVDYIKSSLTSGDFHAVNLQVISAHIKAISGDLFTSLHASMDNYTIEGRASSGDVAINLPIVFDTQSENYVKGSTGNGEKNIRLQVHSGDIRVQAS